MKKIFKQSVANRRYSLILKKVYLKSRVIGVIHDIYNVILTVVLNSVKNNIHHKTQR